MLDILFGEGHTALHLFRVATWVLLMGGAAWKTGEALANRWRPWTMLFGYVLLLGVADRFLIYALYFGDLWSPVGYLVDTAILMTIAAGAFRMTTARNMVKQYPWLYVRTGIMGWREAAPQDAQDA